ncbi:AAA-like domain-containing protein [Phormidium tenue FACHB-886]|nr:AAA-like domain-containing protein [Phormidium tenue FACHB-886]
MPQYQRLSYFQVGGSLPIGAPSYVARQADETLYRAVLAQEFCYVLGPRQMGKSSLRVQMQQRLQADSVHCGTVDMATIGTQLTLDQWYASVLGSLASSLQLQVDLPTWWRDRADLPLFDRLQLFLETVLLVQCLPVAVFVDEIDIVLSLDFSVDDFFGLIRFCYDQRADHPLYRCLTFVLLGVAAPLELIADSSRSPFPVGRAIELQDFQIAEAAPLLPGLAMVSVDPEALLREILKWTGGQPFLTQKVCQTVIQHWGAVPKPQTIETEQATLAELIRLQFIERWELQDEPPHLRTIRNRLCSPRTRQLYQQIIASQQQEKPAYPASAPLLLAPLDGSPEQAELLLSGLVEAQHGYLYIKNAIYQAVFSSIYNP